MRISSKIKKQSWEYKNVLVFKEEKWLFFRNFHNNLRESNHDFYENNQAQHHASMDWDLHRIFMKKFVPGNINLGHHIHMVHCSIFWVTIVLIVIKSNLKNVWHCSNLIYYYCYTKPHNFIPICYTSKAISKWSIGK